MIFSKSEVIMCISCYLFPLFKEDTTYCNDFFSVSFSFVLKEKTTTKRKLQQPRASFDLDLVNFRTFRKLKEQELGKNYIMR